MLKELINETEMELMLERLAFQIIEECPSAELCLVGIHRRGVTLSKRIHSIIKKHKNINLPLGALDITLYRDDLSEIGSFPAVYGSDIPFNINGKSILLIDDVIYTGRTIRAAIDAVIDYGRPAKILLMALIERGHRELPIQPNFTGKNIPTVKNEDVQVHVREIDGDNGVYIRKV